MNFHNGLLTVLGQQTRCSAAGQEQVVAFFGNGLNHFQRFGKVADPHSGLNVRAPLADFPNGKGKPFVGGNGKNPKHGKPPNVSI